jgi:hypothetical protein
MKIYTSYLEGMYDDCEIEAEEKVVDAKINLLQEKAKTDNRITIDDNNIFMIGDLHRELGLDSAEEFDEFIKCYDCGDWIDVIKGIKINKINCIKLLIEKIESEDSNIVDLIKVEFSKERMNNDFIYELINTQIKYVLLDKIQELQKILIDTDFKNIKWR